MKELSHRERVLRAINRQKVDRPPVDLGGMFVTSIIAEGYTRLKKYLGISSEIRIQNRRSRLPFIDEEVLLRFNIDTRGVYCGAPKNRPAKEYSDGSYRDEWDILRKKAEGGHYINVDGPFQLMNNPAPRDVTDYGWVDPNDPGWYDGVREQAEHLHKTTDYAVILSLPVGVVHTAQFMRGYDHWLMDLILRPDFMHALMDTIVEIQCEIIKNLLKTSGEFIDCVLYGDDVAVKNGSLVSLPMYREFILPRHRKIFQTVKKNSAAKIIYHSCGSVVSLMEEIIGAGVDVLNPVQVNADSMDTARLKNEFGGRISFWGGIDTSHVLPFGTPEDVRKEVQRRIQDLNSSGGYVVAAVHNIQPDVPPENICAMFDAVRDIVQ